MAKKVKIINPGGINGTNEGVVNTNSKDYKSLQNAVQAHAEKQSAKARIKYKFISLRLQIENYISNEQPGKILRAGDFLKEYLNVVGIKNKEFAKFIDIEESNLSSILRGRRKINIELAFKLGQVFNINSNLWLLIQSKNELLQLVNDKETEYKKYSLEDLMKKRKK